MFQICICTPSDGPYKGMKHVALLTQDIRSGYVRRQHV